MSTVWRDRILNGSKYQIPSDLAQSPASSDRILEDVAVGMDYLEQNPTRNPETNKDDCRLLWEAIETVHTNFHSGSTMGVVINNVLAARKEGWKNYLNRLRKEYHVPER